MNPDSLSLSVGRPSAFRWAGPHFRDPRNKSCHLWTNETAVELAVHVAVHVLHAIDHIPEKIR
jgi:hypothetical protein